MSGSIQQRPADHVLSELACDLRVVAKEDLEQVGARDDAEDRLLGRIHDGEALHGPVVHQPSRFAERRVRPDP